MYQYNQALKMHSALHIAGKLHQQPLPPLSRLALSLVLTLVAWDLRRRTRKDLARLSGHLLRDVGIDPAHAQAETDKPFWRD